MNNFITLTGLGYIRNAATGKVVSRCDLPAGEHPLADGLEFVEVQTRAELAAVQVDKQPADIEAGKEAADKAAIQAKIEQIAIERLKQDGYVFAANKYKAFNNEPAAG